jgi:hypothetical protein
MAKFNLKEHIAKNKATFFGSLTEGQFSWMTQDTGQQIGSQDENTIPVYMFDNKGKYWFEREYEGYGVFGGKDYYELLDQMNGGSGDRSKGIDLAFDKSKEGETLFPALVVGPSNFNYKTHDFTQEAKHDPNQSWYDASYEEEDEDEDYGGFGDMDKEEDYDYSDEEELDEGFQGQFYAPEYLEQKYGKEMASKITAEIDEMDANSYDRFTEFTSAEEVEDYISDIKDMMDLNEGEAAYEYEKGKSAGEAIEKKKMKVSELKAKIKEMVIAEIDIDVDNETSEYDFLKEIEEMLNEDEGLTPLQDYVYQYEIEISGEDRAQEFLDDIKQLNTPQDVYDYYAYGRGWKGSDLNNIFRQVKRKFASSNTADGLTPLQKQAYSYAKERFGFEDAKNSLDQIKTLTTREEFSDWVQKKIEAEKSLSEAEDEEVDAEVTDAEAAADAGAEEEVDTTVDVTTSEVDPNVKSVQDALTQAQAAAQQLGDKKLMDQIGNTITFFTRAHVVEKPKGAVAENINEMAGKTLEITKPEDLKKVEGSQIFKYDVFDREESEKYKVYILADDKSQAEKIAKEKFPKQFPPYTLDTGYPQKSNAADNLWIGKEKNSFWYGVEKTGTTTENMKEGYFGANNEVEELIDTLGYETMDEFFSDNPGVITAILDWAAGVPEFRKKMIANGLLEAKKENMNESMFPMLKKILK